MPFGHDMAHSLTTVVELINTCPAVDGKEGLADLDALREFVTRRQVSASNRSPTRISRRSTRCAPRSTASSPPPTRRPPSSG